MPNWTTNRLTIKGTQTEVAAFLAKAADRSSVAEIQDFSFKSFIPQPPNLYQGPVGPDHVGPNWYAWNCENWGTKWDACHVGVERKRHHELVLLAQAADAEEPPAEAVINFDTAWAHPEPVIEAIFNQHPELDILHEFMHEGGYGGGITYREGDEILEEGYSDESPEARDLSINLKGCDPWNFCIECYDELDEEPSPEPQKCSDCKAKEK